MTITRTADTRQAPTAGTRFRLLLRKYYFAFALALFLALLITNLLVQRDFGWVQQVAVFAPLALAAMASTPAILAGRGGIDLSISPLMTFCSMVFATWLIPLGLGGWPSVPLILLLGAAVGLVNGLLTVLLRIPAVVVTLAMYFVLAGLSLRISPSTVGIGDNWVGEIDTGIAGFPGALVLILVPVIAWAVLSRTLFGRQLFAVGGNDATALSSGVGVRSVRIAAFAFGGAIAGLGSFALLSVVHVADPGQSTAYTLLAIASVALGGTTLLGGRGGLLGSLLGAGSIFLVQSLLTVLKVPAQWLGLFYGGVLLVAVVVGALISRSGRTTS